VTGSPPNRLLVQPFPAPGQLVALAYRELDRAATGSPEQIRALGDARLLPRRGSRRLVVARSCGSSCGRGWTRLSIGWSASTSGRLPTRFPRVGRSIHTWCMRSRCWPISDAALAMHSPVTPWRNGTPQPARLHRTDEVAAAEPLRGRSPTVAGERPLHPVRGRDQPTHPGRPVCGGRRFFETNRGVESPASTAGAG
jgi:hypothetical protein